jgi:hypothetical protein
MLLTPLQEVAEVGVEAGVIHISNYNHSSPPFPQGTNNLSKT